MTDNLKRCDWANSSSLEQEYHDKYWSVPIYDDKELFRMLILEGKQAGLSWSTILNKMETLDAAFDNFEPSIIITYDEAKIESLMKNPGIIRHKLKIEAVIHNAHAYYNLCEEFGSLSKYMWSFVDNKPIINNWNTTKEVPSKTSLSEKISNDLKKKNFKFVGPTIIYSFMQAVGMINDHLNTCDFK